MGRKLIKTKDPRRGLRFQGMSSSFQTSIELDGNEKKTLTIKI